MEKQTKILLGLVAAGVVAYLVLKPKKAVAASISVNNKQEQGGGVKDATMNKELDKINNFFKSRVSPINGECPYGYYQETIYCITAPCPEGMCVPNPEY